MNALVNLIAKLIYWSILLSIYCFIGYIILVVFFFIIDKVFLDIIKNFLKDIKSIPKNINEVSYKLSLKGIVNATALVIIIIIILVILSSH